MTDQITPTFSDNKSFPKNGFLSRLSLVAGCSVLGLLIMFPASAQEAPAEAAKEEVTEKTEDAAKNLEEGKPNPLGPSKEALATLEMMDKVLKELDPDLKRERNSWQLDLGTRQMVVIADPNAGRMRVMVPIRTESDLSVDDLSRMMQANFDTALDARYAIARGLLWGTYIHPLTGLSKKQFESGLAQTLSIVLTYGTTYSSSENVFGGGDSKEQIDEKVKDLEAKTIA